jgi:glycosyltransferase involved in cell wall biosynthesis
MSALRVSFFFPVFRDEGTVRTVAEKALSLLSELCSEYEIIIIDDGSPDRSGEIADELAREHEVVRVIHHGKNLGYGAAVRSGLAASRFECICLTDGDDEYEVEDFRKLLNLKDRYDLVITFRYKKIYSNYRIFVSWIYNRLLRLLFRMPFRDVSTGLRMVRKSVIDDLELESTSPFIGAEIAIKAMLKGYAVGEVGIQTFPRAFGKGATVSLPNILATMSDVFRVYRKVFSDSYDLPANRVRR